MKNISQIITNKLQSSLNSQSHFFEEIVASKQYSKNPISLDNFSLITKSPLSLPLIAIDGGNATLISSPSFELSVVRVAAVTFIDGKLSSSTVETKYLLVNLEKNEYVCSFIEENGEMTEFQRFSYTSFSFTDSVKIQAVSSLCRRLVELEYAMRQDDKLILLDGSLHSVHPVEKMYIDQLISKRLVCALSKSMQFVTTSGYALNSFLLNQQDGCWIVSDILLHRDFFVYFAHFHNQSSYVFRMDVSRDVDITKIGGVLAAYSIDPVFLGYPYPLIRVDDLARISDTEKDFFREKLFSQLPDLTKRQLKQIESSQSAHSILDSIRF